MDVARGRNTARFRSRAPSGDQDDPEQSAQTGRSHMRARRLLPVLAVFLMSAAPPKAAVPHVVQPGEPLWSIAAANNLTTRTVAAFNGLSENSQVVLGSTVMVPSSPEGYAALQKAGLVSSTPATSTAPATAAVATAPAAAPAPQGA